MRQNVQSSEKTRIFCILVSNGCIHSIQITFKKSKCKIIDKYMG